MIKVKFFTILRLYLGIDEVDIEEDKIDVRTLLKRVSDKIGNEVIHEKLLDADGSLLTGTIILKNGHDIIHIDNMDTIIENGDSISLFTPGGGG